MATQTGSKRKLSVNIEALEANNTLTLGGNGVATQSWVNTQISNLVASAPATLDTLNELAAALGDDPNFATTTSTALGNRLRVDTASQGLNSTQKSNGRTNLGLGTAATSNAGDFASSSHSHSWSQITSKPTTFTPSAHNHNGVYMYAHSPNGGDFNDLTTTKNSNHVAFNANNITDAPDTAWYNGLVTTHSNYLSSYIVNKHRTNDWYLGWRDTNTTPSSNWSRVWHSRDFSSTNVSNWNTAYGWGNHASAGYLTSLPSHTHTFASLTSKPTTLSGYGITDAASSSHNHDNRYITLAHKSSSGDWDADRVNGVWRLTGAANNPFGGSHATGIYAMQTGSAYGWQMFASSSNNNDRLLYRYKQAAGSDWEAWQTIATHDWVNGRGYLTSVPSEYLTQTEGDARYLQSLPSHNHDDRYLQSLPSHNHDGRYYTETESDSRYIPFAGNRDYNLAWTLKGAYLYDSTNGSRHKFYKLGQLGTNGGEIVVEVLIKHDVNYWDKAQSIISVSTWNSTSISVQHDSIGAVSKPIRCVIDTERNVYIAGGVEWDSYLSWRFIYKNNFTDTSADDFVFLSDAIPSDMVEIEAGYSIRTNQNTPLATDKFVSEDTIVGHLRTRGNVYTESHGTSANWKQAYDNYITGISITGTTTKTITLTQRDGGTISDTFSDLSGAGGDGNDFLINGTWDEGSETLSLEVQNQAPININLSGTMRDTDTNTWRGIHDTPVDGATTTSISSNWAFDNVKTAVPANAVFTDTQYSVGDGGLTQKNFTTTLKNKLDGIASGAEVNVQSDWNATTGDALILNKPTIPSGNAVIDWTVSQTANIHADNYTNTTYTVGDGGLTEKNFTSTLKTKLDGISANANNYSHPTGAGNNHIPSGGSAGQFLKYSSSGVAVWATPSYTTNTDTQYSAGSGLDLTGTTFSIEPDLRDGITRIGKDTSNYIAIDADNNNSIDFYISGVWVARMEADGDLHMKGDVVAFSNIFNP